MKLAFQLQTYCFPKEKKRHDVTRTSLCAFMSGLSVDYAKQSRNKFPVSEIYFLKDGRTPSFVVWFLLGFFFF